MPLYPDDPATPASPGVPATPAPAPSASLDPDPYPGAPRSLDTPDPSKLPPPAPDVVAGLKAINGTQASGRPWSDDEINSIATPEPGNVYPTWMKTMPGFESLDLSKPQDQQPPEHQARFNQVHGPFLGSGAQGGTAPTGGAGASTLPTQPGNLSTGQPPAPKPYSVAPDGTVHVDPSNQSSGLLASPRQVWEAQQRALLNEFPGVGQSGSAASQTFARAFQRVGNDPRKALAVARALFAAN